MSHDSVAFSHRHHGGIPILGTNNRNEAARFVTLIDALYEYKVKFFASADAAPTRYMLKATAVSNSTGRYRA